MVTEESIKQFSEQCSRIFEETGKDMIGQSEVVEDTIIALMPEETCCWRACPASERRVW